MVKALLVIFNSVVSSLLEQDTLLGLTSSLQLYSPYLNLSED